jgi:hypothetical protein
MSAPLRQNALMYYRTKNIHDATFLASCIMQPWRIFRNYILNLDHTAGCILFDDMEIINTGDYRHKLLHVSITDGCIFPPF